MIVLLTVSTASPAGADTPPAENFALGLKRGDGLGNSPGIDFTWSAHSKIMLGLAGYLLPEEAGRGIAYAPSIQFRSSDAVERLVPFASFGLKYLQRKFGGRWGSGTGFFGALGAEWNFASGISLRAGIGIHVQREVRAQDANVSISQPGHGGLFLESGLRYWF